MKKNGVESVEDLMEKVFEAIRKETFAKSEKKASYKPKFLNQDKTEVQGKDKAYKRNVRLTHEQRKERVQKKIASAQDNIKMLEQNN